MKLPEAIPVKHSCGCEGLFAVYLYDGQTAEGFQIAMSQTPCPLHKPLTPHERRRWWERRILPEDRRDV